MEKNELGKYTRSFGLSLSITVVLSALLVLIKESSETVLAFMKNLTFHHWVTHDLFALIVFFALGFGLAQLNHGEGPDMKVSSLITVVMATVVVSGLIIAGFYLIEG